MLYLNSKDIMRAITLDEVMDAVSEAYLLFDKGTCYAVSYTHLTLPTKA